MNSLKINKIEKIVSGKVQITGSKSETNRLLILQQFYPNLTIENASNSDDSILMKNALESSSNEINIGHAGTAMRFLTAYFSVKENSEIILTGSHRMKERPIKILVDALISLGADIKYVENEGFPPLKITGKKLTKSFVEIEGNVSSQYISALLLIAPTLQNGLKLKFKGDVTSVPYIKMTLQLLEEIGIAYSWENNLITIHPKPIISSKTIVVESDWSSASYYYSLCALSPNSEITLTSYKQTSIQGDAVLAKIYEHFGVETTFGENSITLKNKEISNINLLNLNLISAPDIAQTIAATCFGLGTECFLTGLHTLKIKETDRLVALKTEIEKLGGEVEITNETLHLKKAATIKENISIATYHDHRMAMAFAPLALKVPIVIEDADVVSKSYPSFWEDFEIVTL
ncbi:3-phosphoshikimate 1-carboxyvinyltransferase [Lutibacter maritimus]|uniref:3-phosphoshikimate 1-carboxyvinyltransferase n=1 Tax=Lutibacter maritimus TaxID=593133 RepID=A0A1I6QQ81_9FLAO|nr:3-phosphoshikimate 1-carboxyvinyltransferase [Lutibacter maritimus]SFS54545.1 3-phosphoshikimate 1-carboxyvinyltransferase [Lutibacter maritimus]